MTRPSAQVVEMVDVGGRQVRFTNPAKVLWPAAGFTKADLLAYYRAIAPTFVAHIAARPLTLGRWPDGTEALGWLQTTCPHPPGWIPTHPVARQKGSGPGRDYCIVNEEAALVWVVNLGTIEFHGLLSRLPDAERPDTLLFDLDPGDGAGIAECCAVALRLREILAGAGLEAVAKTSGQAGLHVAVPLAAGSATYSLTKTYARATAAALVADRPDLVVDRMRRSERQGKVFIDWSQNDQHKSTVAPYSLRATPWPLASTPITWEEVEAGAAGRYPLLFDAAAVRRRLDTIGDLFRPVIDLDQRLPA
jgi:bifunctional non-homologous end joining protein LigD